MERDERELVRRFRSGDRAAFDAVYERYAPRVMGFALRLSGRHAEAEDLVQEVFLAAYAGRETFRERSSLLTWLLGIAARRWRDGCRRERLETVSPLEETELPGLPRSPARSPIEEQVLRSVTLAQALARLDAPFRAALLLVASQGLTYKEAAEVLGEPVGTVKWRVSEAARRMRHLLRASEEKADELQEADERFLGCPCSQS
jgi:RNA polymerase sigma-70 factor (ECF subfamily)